MKVTDLKENEVIHCETLEQYDAICKLLHEAGLRWQSGRSYLEKRNWVHLKQSTCINPKTGVYESVSYYKDFGYKIYPATAFITLTQTKEEYAKERAIGFICDVLQKGYLYHAETNTFYSLEVDPSTGIDYSVDVDINELYDEYLKSLLQTQD